MLDNSFMLPKRDLQLVQIVDAALASAALRGGAWLACRPGCTPCCHGVFRISALDAARLQAGLHTLHEHNPERAAAVRERARAFVLAISPIYPGDTATGSLSKEDESWEAFADTPETEAPCPVLDPATGHCDLYAARPLTCRVFGPPVRNEYGLGICDLCYAGAGEAEILAGEMHLNHLSLETDLDAELAATGHTDETVIAWALLRTGLQ